jgi:quinol-cytochrome oxidoreductase complex cytochrome b subunit
MIIIVLLVVAFIGITLHLSFANEEPEVKIVGLTFFISLFLIGPCFAGIISIHAPVPLESENTIEVAAIIIALLRSGLALVIYKKYEKVKLKRKERNRNSR